MPVTKGQICRIPSIRQTYRDRKENGGYQGLEEGGDGGFVFNGYGVSVWKDEKFWGWMV